MTFNQWENGGSEESVQPRSVDSAYLGQLSCAGLRRSVSESLNSLLTFESPHLILPWDEERQVEAV